MPASSMDQPFSGVRIASYFVGQVRDDVHARRIQPEEEGLVVRPRLVDELERVGEDLVVDGLHPLRTERAGVLDLLLADLAPARLHRRVVHVGRPGVEHVARADRVLRRRRVVGVAGVFHRVEVVEVAVELVEAVDRGQELVQVAQVVLAELAGGVAHRLQRRGDRRRLGRHADRRAGLADGRHAGADRELAGDEVRAARRAARLGVVVGEPHALGREPVEVRRPAGHDALVVGADVEPADVVAHDEDDVRLLLLRCGGRGRGEPRAGSNQEDTKKTGASFRHELLLEGRTRTPGWRCGRAALYRSPIPPDLLRRGDLPRLGRAPYGQVANALVSCTGANALPSGLVYVRNSPDCVSRTESVTSTLVSPAANTQ